MFIQNDDDLIAKLAEEYDLDDLIVRMLRLFVQLPDDKRAVIVDYLRSVAVYESEPASAAIDVDREVDEYRAELEAQKNPAEKSSASDIGVG